MRRSFATLALLAVFVPAAASAGTVYEVNTTGATDTGSKNNQNVYIGQSFNSGTNTQLTSASLQINRESLSIADFTLALHLATGSPGNYFKTGSAIRDITYSNSILSPDLATFYDFTDLNWPLTPNTVYMIGITSESTPTVKWTLNQSVTQTGSTGFITGFVGYNAQSGSSVDNGLHGATITAVPEPSAGLLVGVAAAGLGMWAGRRAGRTSGRGFATCGESGPERAACAG